MSTLSPFELGGAIGANVSRGIGGGIQRAYDTSAIDQILGQAAKFQNPEDVQNLMGQILTRVSPENRQAAFEVLKSKYERMKKTKEATTKHAGEIARNLPNFLKGRGMIGLPQSELDKVNALAIENLPQTGDPYLAMDAALKQYNLSLNQPQSSATQEAAQPKTQYTRGSAVGALASALEGMKYSDYEKLAKTQPGLANALKSFFAQTAVDLPLMGVGGELGGTAGAGVGSLVSPGFGTTTGAIVGGGAGAFALPAMVKEGAIEYMKYKERGGEGNFRDFLNSTNEVLKSGQKAALSGTTLGILNKALPLLEKIPALKNLFEKPYVGKPAEFATKGAALGTSLTGMQAIAEGRMPTRDEVISNYAGAFAFESLPKAQKYLEKSYDFIKNSKNPSELVQKSIDRAKETIKPTDSDEVKGSKLLRSVSDVSKEMKESKPAEVFKGKPEAPTKEVLKEAEKTRKEQAKQIALSPLELQFPPEKEVESRPETIEKRQEKAREVQSRIEPINKELQGIRNKVAEAEHALRTQSLSSTSRMGKVKDIQEWRRQEKILKDQIKDLEYEKNYGRPPETPLEIVENARKSIDKLTKAIEEGNEEDIQLSEKALQKNKQVLETAENLAKRGRLSQEEAVDHYSKIKKIYIDAYKNAIENIDAKLAKLEGKRSTLAKKAIPLLKKQKAILNERMKRAEADLLIQQDKRAIQKMTSGAKGAFLRNQVSKIRSDIEALQGHFRVQKNVYDRLLDKHINQLSIKTLQNPTIENIKEMGEAAGLSKSEIKDTVDMTTDLKDGVEKQDENKINKVLEKVKDLEKSKMNPKAKKAILKTILGIGVQLMKKLGIPIPTTMKGRILSLGGLGYISVKQVIHWVEQIKEAIEVSKVRKYREEKQIKKMYDYLNSFSDEKRRKIMKKVMAEPKFFEKVVGKVVS